MYSIMADSPQEAQLQLALPTPIYASVFHEHMEEGMVDGIPGDSLVTLPSYYKLSIKSPTVFPFL